MDEEYFTPIIIIPLYNHLEQFLKSYPSIKRGGTEAILVINDGSDPAQSKEIAKLCEAQNFLYMENPRNMGKGYSIIRAFNWAYEQGFSHALQIDADGQHCASDIKTFLKASTKDPNAVICGKPIYDSSAPKERLIGRKITKFWVKLETLNCHVNIGDSLCGFRLYPLKLVKPVFDSLKFMRMGFDTESIVKIAWSGIKIVNIPTKVTYPKDGVSHFRVIRDNISLVMLHTYLCSLLFINFIRNTFYTKKVS